MARRWLAQRAEKRRALAAQKLGRVVGRWLAQVRLQRQLRAVFVLQRQGRMQGSRKRFLRLKRLAVALQSAWRGRRDRSAALVARVYLFFCLRRHLLDLWSVALTPLTLRSAFWLCYRDPTLLGVAVLADEVKRLWAHLRLFDLPTGSIDGSTNNPGKADNDSPSSFQASLKRASKILRQHRHTDRSTTTSSQSSPSSPLLLPPTPPDVGLLASSSSPSPSSLLLKGGEREKVASAALTEERKTIYLLLKAAQNSTDNTGTAATTASSSFLRRRSSRQQQGSSNDTTRSAAAAAAAAAGEVEGFPEHSAMTAVDSLESHFNAFGISDLKRRKQALSQLVWPSSSSSLVVRTEKRRGSKSATATATATAATEPPPSSSSSTSSEHFPTEYPFAQADASAAVVCFTLLSACLGQHSSAQLQNHRFKEGSLTAGDPHKQHHHRHHHSHHHQKNPSQQQQPQQQQPHLVLRHSDRFEASLMCAVAQQAKQQELWGRGAVMSSFLTRPPPPPPSSYVLPPPPPPPSSLLTFMSIDAPSFGYGRGSGARGSGFSASGGGGKAAATGASEGTVGAVSAESRSRGFVYGGGGGGSKSSFAFDSFEQHVACARVLAVPHLELRVASHLGAVAAAALTALAVPPRS